MFNFDFQKTAIFRAMRISEGLFASMISGLKAIFFVVSVCSAFIFIFANTGAGLGDEYDFLLGFSLVFFSFGIICFLISSFIKTKISNPKIPEITPVVNIAEFLSIDTARGLDYAIKFSKKKNIFPINTSIFLYFLLKENPKLNFILSRLLIDIEALGRKLTEHFSAQKSQDSLSHGIYSQKFEQSMKDAFEIAQSKKHKHIEPGDMFFALAKNEPTLGLFLLEADLRPNDVRNAVIWWEEEEDKKKRRKRFWDYDNLARKGSIGRSWSSGYTITLDEYAIDYNQLVLNEWIETVIGYEKEIEQVESTLSSPAMNNVLLVGEPGVGMENVIKAIAVKSNKGQSLQSVNYNRVLELKIPQLLAQMQNLDQVEDVLDKIFKEALNAGNVILVIDEFHNFVGREPAPGKVDISGLISSYLKFPEFKIIAIASYAGLHKNIEENPTILNLFSKVEIQEPTPQETMRMLQKMAPVLEAKYHKFITYPALKQILELTGRYIADVPFPKKAIEVLEEAMVKTTTEKGGWILPEDIDKIVSRKTEIPVGKIETEEKEILLNLEGLIHQRIINQEEAVREVSTALRRARAKLKERKGPMGGFLFLGPTGVGKTETSKALSEIYFGSEEKMIRLDMSEFQSQEDIPRLMGFSGTEGLLTTPVRENPFSLILLDEIEKAHPNILNLFLQVLDDGRITDGLGRRIDFKNAIIIATSNAGYEVILDALKNNLDFSIVKEKLLDKLFDQRIFRPEFINRFDAVVLFKPLSKENLLDIAQLMFGKIQEGLIEKNIDFIITQELKEKIVELGYDITFGARNLKRVIQDKVENVLAEALLKDEIKRGDRIEVDPKRFKIKILD
ncbi:ATP-dependent Clp protease ATP-binding subunit [Patescibacteria group bacterium]|nr:ATP-dependent Clp protease ATP-binding subunit [Patescibacteria group bacterium]MBU4022954.1 ATP-dependent Clp protease ATP-binding subunit [Patescibacteria group bacterium]MBU4162097.1 ATP-dependent Clp protease ATP-binding subunit [Patescibacteria group bacterium]